MSETEHGRLQRWDERWRAVLVLGINVLTMGVGYYYQVYAARCLSAGAFLALSLWLGQVGLLGVAATFAQVRGTLVPPRIEARSLPRTAQLVAAVGAISMHLVAPGTLPTTALLVETVLVSVLGAYWTGVLTGRLHLLRVAGSVLLGACARVAYAAHGSASTPAFYEANAFAALVTLALVTLPLRTVASFAVSTTAARSWVSVLLLGTMQAGLPFAQLFAVRATAPLEGAEGLARVMVFTRAPLLLGMALLNIAIAKRVREVEEDADQPWSRRYGFELIAVGQCVLAAPVLVAIGPFAAQVLTGASLYDARATLLASTLDHAALLWVFASVQRDLLRGQVIRASVLLGAITLPPLVFVLVAHVPGEVLLGGHALLCVGAALIERVQSRSSR